MPLDAVDALSELDSETLLWFTENSWVLTKKIALMHQVELSSEMDVQSPQHGSSP